MVVCFLVKGTIHILKQKVADVRMLYSSTTQSLT